MPTIDALTHPQLLALVRFIEACQRLRGSIHWRTTFYDCTRRGDFAPFAKAEEGKYLRELMDEFGPLVVCYLKTADVMRAAAGGPPFRIERG